MLKPFKIKREHLSQYPELEASDIGMFAIRTKDDRDLMLYETKQIAQNAYEYFSKHF